MADGAEAGAGRGAANNAAAQPGQGAAVAGQAVAGEGGTAGTAPRRRKQQEVQEVVDELAQETKRTTLLERVEDQLKGKARYSRMLFGFSVADDRKIQMQIEEEFEAWREKQDKQAADLTGLLVFTSHGGAHLLEGPTELIFAALAFFHELACETTAPQAAARPALTGPVRILHFSEVRGVRASASWTSVVHGGKLQGGQQVQIEESNCSEFTFRVYQKLLLMCAQVKESLQKASRRPGFESQAQEASESVGEDEEAEEKPAEVKFDKESVQDAYKKVLDMLPTVDEIVTPLGKSAADYLFTFPEFQKVFIAPFNLVLHSELLWPMAPALTY